ncbi:hypothetical protein Arub01_50240 [Actinomadura rubrobrunea]|uniref:Uncharacterized protein n=1 Tax=Actinomadura rubrobrunea TaxID=115335 RepID=A0A9W6PZ23_9ACTN|nr:hypothetical protein [Actinomadura rubrobrunea]GLW66780.1 hypothetical protein Arub01_50240 [Actinomadura rubrobrunea]
MQTWDVMRQDDDGGESCVATHDSRIAALAQVLVLQCRAPRGRTYRVCGPSEPAVRTNRDLYLHFLHLGQEARAASWSLSAFLRSLWKVSGPLSDRESLAPDDVAAMFSAASTAPPPDFVPAWSTEDLSLPGDEPRDHADWERVILSQIADLQDFLAAPPGPHARFGVDAPRPPGSGPRATPARWYNFDPATYLECAVAGSLGGWDAADGARVPLPTLSGEAPTRSYVRPLTSMTWGDLARIAVCGQMYE